MASRSRILWLAAAGLIGLAAVAAVALTLDYDSPALGRALLGRLSARGDLELEAEGFRLNLLQGLKLETVKVRSELPSGSLTATAEELILEHRIAPLLRGEILLVQIVLERPEVELVSYETAPEAVGEPGGAAPGETRAGGGEAATSAEAGSELTLRIHRFAIVDGTLVARVEGVDEPPTEIRGLDLELRDIDSDPGAASLVQGLRAAGELSAEEVVTATTRATDARGEILLEAGHLRVTDLRLPTELGSFLVSELDVDLNRDPYSYDLSLAGDPLRTHRLLGGDAAGGFGSGRLSLSLSGELNEEMNLAGLGALAVSAGKLPKNAVLESLESLLRTPIAGEEYEPFEIGFTIERNRLVADPFAIVAGDLELAASGWAGLLDEAMSLQLSARAPRERIDVEEIPEEVLEALTDADGRVNLPILVTGSQGSPVVRFDRSGWGKIARKRLEREAEKELGKALGRLFGKKRKD